MTTILDKTTNRENQTMNQNDTTTMTEGEYEFTTIDYSHSDPQYRSNQGVSVYLQMDYGEIVAGAFINTVD